MPSQSQSNLQRKRSRWTRWRYMFWDSVTRLRKTVWVFIWRNSVTKKWPRCTWGATTTQWLFLIPNRVIIRFFSLFSQRLGRSKKKHYKHVLKLYKSRGNFSPIWYELLLFPITSCWSLLVLLIKCTHAIFEYFLLVQHGDLGIFHSIFEECRFSVLPIFVNVITAFNMHQRSL